MPLSAGDRAQVSRVLQEDYSREHQPFALTKPQQAVVLTAIDDWIDSTMAASLNAALPAAARTAMTADQKLDHLMALLRRRTRGS